jgi:phosphoglycerate dehydrogenase-like enzyme
MRTLVEALKEGHLAGAVIDVCRQEPLPAKRHPFWTAWGLLLTGHSSAPTSRVDGALFIDNLRAYQAGSRCVAK